MKTFLSVYLTVCLHIKLHHMKKSKFFFKNIWWFRKNAILLSFGEVAEWSIAAVLKTVELRGSGGSNPSLSAAKGVNQVVTRFTPFFTPKNQGGVYFF